MSLTCSNCQQSSCADSASCNDNSDDQGFEYVRHHRQGSCGSAKLNRRHKSASPSRRSGRGSKGSRPNSKGGGYIQEGGSHSRGHSQTRGPGGEPRSKSAGHLTQQSCHHHCHCNCESERSRSRSRSNCCQHQIHPSAASMPPECDCGDCSGHFTRYGKSSQSTRSTQWEVYRQDNGGGGGGEGEHASRSRNPSQRAKKKSSTSSSKQPKQEFLNCNSVSPFQINIPAPDSKDDDSDEMDIGQLRMAATTTANKAHSWRGDHPMKNPATGHYHPIMTAQPVGPHHHAQPINHHQHTAFHQNNGRAKSKSFNPYTQQYMYPHPPPVPMGPPSAGQGASTNPKPYHFGQQFVKQGPSSSNPRSLPHGGVRLIGLGNQPPPHH